MRNQSEPQRTHRSRATAKNQLAANERECGACSLSGNRPRHSHWHLLFDGDAETFQSGDSLGMVGKQAYLMDIQVGENLRAYADFSLGFSLVIGGSRRSYFAVKYQPALVVYAKAF